MDMPWFRITTEVFPVYFCAVFSLILRLLVVHILWAFSYTMHLCLGNIRILRILKATWSAVLLLLCAFKLEPTYNSPNMAFKVSGIIWRVVLSVPYPKWASVGFKPSKSLSSTLFTTLHWVSLFYLSVKWTDVIWSHFLCSCVCAPQNGWSTWSPQATVYPLLF